jgi:hypothetical protein
VRRVRLASLTWVTVASLFLGACGNDRLESSAVSDLYGGSHSLSSAEISCIEDASPLDEFVEKARHGQELWSTVSADGSSAVVSLLQCFGDRFRNSLAAAFVKRGRSKEVAECEADFWVSELDSRAKAGKPIATLMGEPDFDTLKQHMNKVCKPVVYTALGER